MKRLQTAAILTFILVFVVFVGYYKHYPKPKPQPQKPAPTIINGRTFFIGIDITDIDPNDIDRYEYWRDKHCKNFSKEEIIAMALHKNMYFDWLKAIESQKFTAEEIIKIGKEVNDPFVTEMVDYLTSPEQ